jgi:hypothetical protein
MGCSAARPGGARAVGDRLGNPARERSTGGSAGALLERAGSTFFMGCPQDRGACRSRRAVLVGTGRIAQRFIAVVGTRSSRTPAARRCLGTSARGAGTTAGGS